MTDITSVAIAIGSPHQCRMLRGMRDRVVVAALVFLLSACNGDDSNGKAGDTIDASVVDAFVCMDAYEPNNTLMVAVPAAVGSTLTGVMICPAGDKDTFAFQVATMGENVEVVIESAEGEPVVGGSVLNKEGTPIMNASPVAGSPNKTRMYLPNNNTGTLYAQAYAQPADVSHYKITVTLTPPH